MDMANKNFARGEAPPPHSYEWSGVAKPPEAPGKGPPKDIPVIVAVSETIIVKAKKRPWLMVLGAGVLGFFLGHRTARH
jgi:hypothetical protein